MTFKVQCPTCKKEIEWTNKNIYRPFCSSECKMIDLGAWADDKYQIESSEDTLEDDKPSNPLNP